MTAQGRPLSLIYNQKSGFHRLSREEIYQKILELFLVAGFEIESFEITTQSGFEHVMAQVLQRHSDPKNRGVVVAAGGDGTLNAVAQQLIHGDIPLGILPLGTFNYVARLHNIPLDLLQAAQVIVEGQLHTIHVAKMNQHIYLNNASLGLYPLFIQKREHYNRLLGRLSIHAYTSGLAVLLRHHKQLKLHLQIDEKSYALKTPLLFFGNNQLQLAELNLRIADAVAQGKLAGIMIAKSNKWTWLKILSQLLQAKLEQADDVYSFSAQHITVNSKAKKLSVAIDGEIVQMQPPLKLSVLKNALTLMVPA